MGEWMSAEVHVRVPDDVDIDIWLRPSTDRYNYPRTVLGMDGDPDDEVSVPGVIDAMVATAAEGVFDWEWDPERRLLSDGGGELEVNYGLDDWFSDLAEVLRAAGWGYHFESSGRYEIPGECWEWMPGWLDERRLVQSGELKAIDRQGLQTALDEARRLGVDPGEYLLALMDPWPGWNHTSISTDTGSSGGGEVPAAGL